MATSLGDDKNIPLNFTSGTILVLKSQGMVKPSGACGFALDLKLFNETDDILLNISFLTSRIIFKDYACRSLGDGWGKEHTVDLKGKSMEGVKVSVHHYLTDSKFGRYQILLDGITVYHFDKRLPGPARRISYFRIGGYCGPSSWDVVVYQIDDLLPEEQLALVQEGAPLKIPNHESTAVSIRPPFHFISSQAYASISWDHWKEIRMYYLGPGNVLHEYAYSASKDKNSWYYGNLHTRKIVLDPTSSIAAIRLEDDDDTICIYYQDPNTDFIRTVNQRGPTKPWKEAQPIAKAVKGSSFAIISDPTDKLVSRIYYQDPELHLRECYYSHLGTTEQWVPGDFNPGVQPRGTSITAEVVRGGVMDINVMWRDAQGYIMSRSWSRSSGWNLANPNGERAPDGRD